MTSIVTPATLEISSEWASFELISAGATLGKDPDFHYPSDTEFNKTGLFFSQEEHFVFQRAILKIYIINDGSPVDFVTTRGDEGRNGSGQITITFAGNTYTDGYVTSDDGLNCGTFYDAPVGATPYYQMDEPHKSF